MESNPGRRVPRAKDPELARSSELYTASDVARFCQVDLKTIHNWADKGEIRHFRTPGRHLRFRRLDVLEFLRRYGYSFPEELQAGRPRLVIVDADANAASALRRALARRFDVTTFADPVDAFVALVGIDPDVLVLDLDMPGCDPGHVVSRLTSNEMTAHIRVFVVTRRSAQLREAVLAAGAVDVVPKEDATRLRDALERLTGA
jgi:excisionase family DNA binding protein